MARKKSEFLKGAGKFWEVFKSLTDAILAAGGDDQDAERIQTDKTLRDKIVALILEGRKASEGIFCVTMDYGKTLAQMIANGKYDWVNDDITAKHFLVSGNGIMTADLFLVHLNRTVSTQDALDEIKRQGGEPAPLEYLLALGAINPDEQRKYPIVALGSVWRHWFGDRYVAFLWSRASERSLSLDWLENDWDARCRFLAVRK